MGWGESCLAVCTQSKIKPVCFICAEYISWQKIKENVLTHREHWLLRHFRCSTFWFHSSVWRQWGPWEDSSIHPSHHSGDSEDGQFFGAWLPSVNMCNEFSLQIRLELSCCGISVVRGVFQAFQKHTLLFQVLLVLPTIKSVIQQLWRWYWKDNTQLGCIKYQSSCSDTNRPNLKRLSTGREEQVVCTDCSKRTYIHKVQNATNLIWAQLLSLNMCHKT